VRTVPKFARLAAELAPLTALPGDRTSDAQRRIAAAALETVGDVIARYYVTYNYVDSGLRGGSFTYVPTNVGYDFNLLGVQWTQDVAVSGSVSWDMSAAVISAHLTLSNGGARLGALDISWNDAEINAVASVSGYIGGRRLDARRGAP
jgi:hypothetical protein